MKENEKEIKWILNFYYRIYNALYGFPFSYSESMGFLCDDMKDCRASCGLLSLDDFLFYCSPLLGNKQKLKKKIITSGLVCKEDMMIGDDSTRKNLWPAFNKEELDIYKVSCVKMLIIASFTDIGANNISLLMALSNLLNGNNFSDNEKAYLLMFNQYKTLNNDTVIGQLIDATLTLSKELNVLNAPYGFEAVICSVMETQFGKLTNSL